MEQCRKDARNEVIITDLEALVPKIICFARLILILNKAYWNVAGSPVLICSISILTQILLLNIINIKS